MSIPLPGLDEQRRIARILDVADSLRRHQVNAIARTKDLASAIFANRFGNSLCTNGQRCGRELRDMVGDIRIGPFGSALHRSDYVHGGVPVINPSHIVEGLIAADPEFAVSRSKSRELVAYQMHAGDIVLGRRGEMGRCAVAQSEHAGFVCGTGSMIIRPDPSQSESMYLRALLSSAPVRRHLERSCQGVTMPNLNKGIVGGLRVNVPPLSDQRRFGREMQRVAEQARAGRHRLRYLDALFASLQHRAFTGAL